MRDDPRFFSELVGQTRQIGRFGTPEQIDQAKTILTETVQKQMLDAVATDAQKKKYMEPYAQGLMKSCIAISEPCQPR